MAKKSKTSATQTDGSDDTKAAKPEKVDGRRARAGRTHTAILDAFLAKVASGEATPTAAAIAEEAGVAERSIRQHFTTREELVVSAIAHQASSIAKAPAAEGALPARITTFVERRTASLEKTAALRRAAVALATSNGHEAVAKALEEGAKARRAELRATFAKELDGGADVLEEALEAVSGGRIWDALRVEHKRSKKRAAEIVEHLVKSLLT